MRQGEPTIVVAIFDYIARVHWKHKESNKRHLQPPITVHHGHTSWVTCPPFWLLGVAKSANGLVVRQGEPAIVVAVFEIIARVHYKHKEGNKRHLHPPITVHHGLTSWATCPLFWLLGVAKSGKWACCWGQGEPTIVVAVFQNIARVHGKHHKGSRRQLQPPITTNISHT